MADYHETLRELGIEEEDLQFASTSDHGNFQLTEKYISRVESTLITWFTNILEVLLQQFHVLYDCICQYCIHMRHLVQLQCLGSDLRFPVCSSMYLHKQKLQMSHKLLPNSLEISRVSIFAGPG